MGAVDKDYHLRREKCSKTVEDMPECKGNDVKRENCVLKCVSPECYEELYGSDPLEEGELDTTRGRLFRNCVKQEVRRMMEEDASAKGNKDEI